MTENTQPENLTPPMKKAECSNCGGLRNCDVQGSHNQRGGDDHFQWHTQWFLLQCKGCEHAFAQTISTNSEDYVDYYDEQGEEARDHDETINYWPALAKRKRPEWVSDAGIDAAGAETLDYALLEVYGALEAGLNMLAGIGIRTTFDVASELLNIQSSLTFQNKLTQLVGDGHIGEVDKARLNMLVEAGNAAAHRGWKPKADELHIMMEVLEMFIFRAFVEPSRQRNLDASVTKIQTAIPQRNQTAVAVPLVAQI